MNTPASDTPSPQSTAPKPTTWQRVLGIFVPFLAGIFACSAVESILDHATIYIILYAISALFLLLIAWAWSAESRQGDRN